MDGHPGGPGRPTAAKELEYLTATRESVSVKDWKVVVKRALKDAKAGNDKARQFLAAYLLGKPQDAGEILAAAEAANQPAPKVVFWIGVDIPKTQSIQRTETKKMPKTIDQQYADYAEAAYQSMVTSMRNGTCKLSEVETYSAPRPPDATRPIWKKT